jgi:hypothetical protein
MELVSQKAASSSEVLNSGSPFAFIAIIPSPFGIVAAQHHLRAGPLQPWQRFSLSSRRSPPENVRRQFGRWKHTVPYWNAERLAGSAKPTQLLPVQLRDWRYD